MWGGGDRAAGDKGRLNGRLISRLLPALSQDPCHTNELQKEQQLSWGLETS